MQEGTLLFEGDGGDPAGDGVDAAVKLAVAAAQASSSSSKLV
jgi:hypothetical protein